LVSRPPLGYAVTNLLNAFYNLLILRFLCAFVGNTIKTDQKFVCKLRAFSIGKSQRVLSQLINGRCHGMIFASGS
jgi:hypothetical protein